MTGTSRNAYRDLFASGEKRTDTGFFPPGTGAATDKFEITIIKPDKAVQGGGHNPSSAADVDVHHIVLVLGVGCGHAAVLEAQDAKSGIALQPYDQVSPVGQPGKGVDDIVENADATDKFAALDIKEIDGGLFVPVPPRPPAAATVLPSGDTATAYSRPSCLASRGTRKYRDQPHFRHLPDTDGLVIGAGDEAVAREVGQDATDHGRVHAGLDAELRSLNRLCSIQSARKDKIHNRGQG